MPKVRIVVAVEEIESFSTLLCALLTPYRDFEVADSVRDEPSLAIALHQLLSAAPIHADDTVVVIASLAGGFSAYARLLLEFPDIILYGVEAQAMTRYRACIEARNLPGRLKELVADLNQISVDGLPSLQIVRPSSEELDR